MIGISQWFLGIFVIFSRKGNCHLVQLLQILQQFKKSLLGKAVGKNLRKIRNNEESKDVPRYVACI